MYVVWCFLTFAIFKSILVCRGQLTEQRIDGSLTGPWTFNFTLFLKKFEGNLLFCADYERNVLLIMANKTAKQENVIVVKFNQEIKSIYLNSLCGCDPCDEKKVNMVVYSYTQRLSFVCNNYGHYGMNKVDIVNKVNNDIKPVILKELNTTNTIYTSVALGGEGCLQSFYRNNVRIQFLTHGTMFLASCPRNCSKDLCNAGKCQALIKTGPDCDCSLTALNGPNCNATLKVFKSNSLMFYERIDELSETNFKLTWMTLLEGRYCLIKLKHRFGVILLTLYNNFLMKGTEVLSDIIPDQINFINIRFERKKVIITVNQRTTVVKFSIFGKVILNVGFTDEYDDCRPFEGKYDLSFDSVQFLSRAYISTKNIYKVGINHIIIGFSSILLLVIISTIVYICVSRRKSTNKQEEIKVVNKRSDNNLKEKSQSDKHILSPYDSIDYGKEYAYSYTKTKEVRPYTSYEEKPELPPRNDGIENEQNWLLRIPDKEEPGSYDTIDYDPNIESGGHSGVIFETEFKETCSDYDYTPSLPPRN